jgi:hypothetical protein
MIFPPSKYDPLGTPLLPDPQEDESWRDDDEDCDEPEDWRIEELERESEYA